MRNRHLVRSGQDAQRRTQRKWIRINSRPDPWRHHLIVSKDFHKIRVSKQLKGPAAHKHLIKSVTPKTRKQNLFPASFLSVIIKLNLVFSSFHTSWCQPFLKHARSPCSSEPWRPTFPDASNNYAVMDPSISKRVWPKTVLMPSDRSVSHISPTDRWGFLFCSSADGFGARSCLCVFIYFFFLVCLFPWLVMTQLSRMSFLSDPVIILCRTISFSLHFFHYLTYK